MMARRRSRLRLALRHTAMELRKWSKSRLIRLILRLEAARISRTGRRRSTRARRRVGSRKSGKKRLSAGVHTVNIRGKSRKVKVLANGQWRFMKSGSKRKTRRRRR